jgi:hypothetical protein
MKMKEIIPQKRDGVITSGKVTIEDEGKEYEFSAQMADLMDDDIFPNLCSVWKREIKKKKEFAKVNEKAINAKLKKMKGKKVGE